MGGAMQKTGLRRLIRRLLPKRVKPHRIIRGPLQGRYLVTSWHDYPAGIGGYTEAALLTWFQKNVKTGECWLDVGAHYGYTAIALSGLVGATGSVWAFEPIPETAGHLGRTARINGFDQLRVLPVALGDPESLTLIRLATVRGMADSTLPATDTPSTILVARLDWLWSRLSDGSSRIQGIKIDVQGMELHVLRGMSNILRSHKPVLVVELHAGVDREEVLVVLRAAGYSNPGEPIEPLPGERTPCYADDHSYVFWPES